MYVHAIYVQNSEFFTIRTRVQTKTYVPEQNLSAYAYLVVYIDNCITIIIIIAFKQACCKNESCRTIVHTNP